MIELNQQTCNNVQEASSLEWLETNGIGGYASSTVAGLNSRRYHGLLVAATQPPVGRTVMLSKLEETLVVGDSRFDLCANRYPGVISPEGFQHLVSFRLEPYPILVFEVGGIRIEKSVLMLHGENTTLVEYAITADNRQRDNANPTGDVSLEIRPLIAFRDFHSTMHETASINPRYQVETGMLTFIPFFEQPAMYLGHNSESINPTGYWYKDFQYDREIERGFHDSEDLFNPCQMIFRVSNSRPARMIASTAHREVSRFDAYRARERERRRGVVAPSRFNDPLVRSLVAAADKFIVARGKHSSVIAGYHWFGDWGRDTMIALPGLTLLTGRVDIAQSILSEFAGTVSQGMIPNRFPDSGETPEYNTVDATLWFIEAARALAENSKSFSFVKTSLYKTLVGIIDWHISGTRYGIIVDSDGLLSAGEEGVQLTWMDAKVGDHVITPRIGKPVEIQALWYNALCIMSDFARKAGENSRSDHYRAMADHARDSFNEKFWNEDAGCLFDVIGVDGKDGSIRPNQIFAVSLAHSMLSKDRAQKVVDVVQSELLTPVGLRTLSPLDPAYIGHYAGGPAERDGAYHQGTVWPWLIGPFLDAFVRVNDSSKESRKQAANWLEPFRAHLNEAGLGQISEVFDGDAPHHPGGCIAQAWSVAEVLRAALEHAAHHGHRTWETKPLQAAHAGRQ